MKQNKKILIIIGFLAIGLMIFSSPKKANAGSVVSFITDPIGTITDAIGVTDSLNDLTGALGGVLSPLIDPLLGVPIDPIRDIAMADIFTCEVNYLVYTDCGGNSPGPNVVTSVDYPTLGDGGGDGCALSCDGYYCGNTCNDGHGPNSDVIWWVGSDCAVHGSPCSVPPQPCTKPCDSCSTICGPGTQTCYSDQAGACIPYTQNCNIRACECTPPIDGWPPSAWFELCSGSSSPPPASATSDVVSRIFDNGSCSDSGPCRFMCSSTKAQIKFNCHPPVNGACKDLGGKMYCQKPPNDERCSSGQATDSTPSDDGKSWKWICKGMYNGDDSVECSALKSCAYREVVPN